MTRDDIIRMAREAGLGNALCHNSVEGERIWIEGADWHDELERFAKLVAAAERNRVWTQDHWTEYERSIVAAEREACAQVCDEVGGRDTDTHAWDAAAAIRQRGEK